MNIIKNRIIYISISVIIIVIGICVMFYNQSQGKGLFNYDIQFTGGTSIQIATNGNEITNDQLIQVFKDVAEVENPQIQRTRDNKTINIKTKSLSSDQRVKIVEQISNKYKIEKSNFLIEDVSATISNEMKKTSILAVSIACVAILIYVSLRFKDFKIGASSILALINDALIVIVFYGAFRIPLNVTFIAALLTVLGYSINSSIVIFDRVRENKRTSSRINNEDLVNKSVNQTLKRSVFTSLTTFFTIICLYIFGVESVKIFTLPITIGIICGTYSSIFMAGSIWYIIANKTKKSVK